MQLTHPKYLTISNDLCCGCGYCIESIKSNYLVTHTYTRYVQSQCAMSFVYICCVRCRVDIIGINRNYFSCFCIIFLIGLKKFLAQYPAIFVIDGDQVLVNSYEKSASNDVLGGGTRDYIQESKDYFKHKLLQYGIGTEVPIKSLLGHRSQASPQIRHISGRNLNNSLKMYGSREGQNINKQEIVNITHLISLDKLSLL